MQITQNMFKRLMKTNTEEIVKILYLTINI